MQHSIKQIYVNNKEKKKPILPVDSKSTFQIQNGMKWKGLLGEVNKTAFN